MNSIKNILDMVCSEAHGVLVDDPPPTNMVCANPEPPITLEDLKAAVEQFADHPVPKFGDIYRAFVPPVLVPELDSKFRMLLMMPEFVRNGRRPIVIDHGPPDVLTLADVKAAVAKLEAAHVPGPYYIRVPPEREQWLRRVLSPLRRKRRVSRNGYRFGCR